MDLSAIIVVIALTIFAAAAIVGLEIHSRKTQPKNALGDETGSDATVKFPRSVSENEVVEPRVSNF